LEKGKDNNSGNKALEEKVREKKATNGKSSAHSIRCPPDQP